MKKQTKADSISTFLGSDADVDGSINFQGTIRVDGKVSGKISSNGGTLIVGEKASIDADVSHPSLFLELCQHGQLGGDVAQVVHLHQVDRRLADSLE